VLGHAQYMKAIHGGNAKNDRLDAQKIAVLLRGGMLPQAYAYRATMRATRDLLRRRLHLVRQRAERLTHLRQTNSQYKLPALAKSLKSKAQREGVAQRFSDPAVQKNIDVDLALIETNLLATSLSSGHAIRFPVPQPEQHNCSMCGNRAVR
jgi:Transposase